MECFNIPDELAALSGHAPMGYTMKRETTTMDLTTVYDCTGAALSSLNIPPGVLMAGYVTGFGGVQWTDAQFTAHPGAIHIDQSSVDTPADETADVLDIEPQAATIADVAPWVAGARASWHAGKRPGQRKPALYVNRSELTPVANALNAAGITSGVNLWIAEDMPENEAIHVLEGAGGPFPIIGVQYEFHDDHDVSVFSTAWLNDVSKAPVTTSVQAGTQSGWRFCHKCQSLFWGPGQAQSVCPRGAQHDGTGSYDYNLGFNQ